MYRSVCQPATITSQFLQINHAIKMPLLAFTCAACSDGGFYNVEHLSFIIQD